MLGISNHISNLYLGERSKYWCLDRSVLPYHLVSTIRHDNAIHSCHKIFNQPTHISSNQQSQTKMDISLLLEPQAKHQRMHRGDSMYDEQSIIELESIRCKHCQRSFAPSTYVRHCNEGKPKCLNVEKRSVYNSAKIRVMSNHHFSTDDKKRVLRTIKKMGAKTRFSLRRRSKANKRNWREESNELRAAVGLVRVARRAMLASRLAKKAKLTHEHPSTKECIYNLI